MEDYKKFVITQGVDLVCIEADRFKTNKLSVSFALDLSKNSASRNALAISMISNCSARYPDTTAINKKLSLLYGASISTSVNKNGEAQMLSVTLTALDDRFSLGGSITSQALDMLLSLLFEPRLDPCGDFYPEDIEREKRILKEKIESEENEKRIYSLRRLESIMFDKEPYSVNKYGCIEDIDAITSDDIRQAIDDMLTRAKIRITFVGNADVNSIKDQLCNAFSKIERDYLPISKAVIIPKAKEVRDVTERIDVKQGKLILGYRVNVDPYDEKYLAVRAFCDSFGGGPYSKLFANVREKLSLCYYCSATYIRRKSCILIQCGCEEQNMDKAIEEIDKQLRDIINGDFATEFASSKKGISDYVLAVKDDPSALCSWYANQLPDEDIVSPDMSAHQNNEVTLEQARHCAELLSLDTIFRLVSE